METRKAWHEEREEYIIARAAEGRTYASIGKELGITRERVRQICGRKGVPGRRPRLDARLRNPEWLGRQIAEGKTRAEIAAEAGCNVMSVTKYRKRFGLPRFRRGPEPKRTLTCVGCGKEFVAVHAVWCSPQCRQHTLYMATRDLIRQEMAKYPGHKEHPGRRLEA